MLRDQPSKFERCEAIGGYSSTLGVVCITGRPSSSRGIAEERRRGKENCEPHWKF